MQKLMYFLFGFITALFVAVMIIEHQGIYFFDEEVYGLYIPIIGIIGITLK